MAAGQRSALRRKSAWASLSSGSEANSTVARGRSQLAPAWAFQIDSIAPWGGMAAVPIVVGATVYAQDLKSNVFALDRATGDVRWATYYDIPSVGPNGVAVGYGRLFATLGNLPAAVALDAETGQEFWRTTLSSQPGIGIDMAPTLHDSVLYVSTVPVDTTGGYRGGHKGVLFALDATENVHWGLNIAIQDRMFLARFRRSR